MEIVVERRRRSGCSPLVDRFIPRRIQGVHWNLWDPLSTYSSVLEGDGESGSPLPFACYIQLMLFLINLNLKYHRFFGC